MKKALLISLVAALTLTLCVAFGVMASADTSVIDEVSISFDAAPALGGEIKSPSLPANAKYAYDSAPYWEDISGHGITETAFEKKYYEVSFFLLPEDGYSFDANVDVKLLGANPTYEYYFKNSAQIEVVFIFDLREEIDSVELTFGEVKVGAPAPVLKAPADADYTIRDYILVNSNGDPDPVLERDVYEMAFYVDPAEGKRISHNTEFTIDGKAVPFMNYEISDDGYIEGFPQFFDLRTPIDSITATVAALEAGKPLPEVALPDGANYTVYYMVWYKDGSSQELTANAENGHLYTLEVILVPKAGYCFVEGLPMVVNGEPLQSYSYSDDIYWKTTYPLGIESAGEPITEVAADLPLLTDGALIDDLMDAVKLPEGANYTLKDAQMSSMNSDSGGEYKANGIYVIQLELQPKAGYYIADDVAFTLTVNGSPSSMSTSIIQQSDMMLIQIIVHPNLYTLNADFPAFPELTVGEPLPRIPSCTPAEGLIFYYAWLEMDEYGYVREIPSTAVVRAGKTYQLVYIAVPDAENSERCVVPGVTTVTAGGAPVPGSMTAMQESYLSVTKTYLNDGKAPQQTSIALTGPEVKLGETTSGSITCNLGGECNFAVITLNEDYTNGIAGKTFEEGKHYQMVLQIISESPIVPADEVSVTYNGKPAKVITILTMSDSRDNLLLFLDFGVLTNEPVLPPSGDGDPDDTTSTPAPDEDSGTPKPVPENPATSDAALLPFVILTGVSTLTAAVIAKKKDE